MSDEILIDLQSRLAFQEQAIHELSEVVYRQQGEIDRLHLALEQMRNRLKAVQESNILRPDEDTPPPHY